MGLDRYRQANLANWESRVPVHLAPEGYGVDALVADPQRLSGVVAFDAPHLGDVRGQRVVHLQCHIGSDTLSLARLGATVTGVDFSPRAIAAARDLCERAGVDARFFVCDLYDAPSVLAGERFDLVYTGVGALNWLPDIRAWARVVAALLADGGRLYLRDGHPMLWALDDERDDDLLVVAHPYFTPAEPLRFETASSYVNPGERLEHPVTYEWNHGVGEMIGAVLDAGLTLTGFREHRELEWQGLPGMVRNDAGRYVLPDRPERLPLMYTLTASKA